MAVAGKLGQAAAQPQWPGLPQAAAPPRVLLNL